MKKEEQITNRERLAQAVLESAVKELTGIVKENLDGILKSYQSCLEENKDAKQYSVSLALLLSPMGRDIGVRAKIGYGVKHTDETEGSIASIDPSLFSEEN